MNVIGLYISLEFREFILQFYQDLLDEVFNQDEMMENVLSFFKDEIKRARLRDYLDTIT